MIASFGKRALEMGSGWLPNREHPALWIFLAHRARPGSHGTRYAREGRETKAGRINVLRLWRAWFVEWLFVKRYGSLRRWGPGCSSSKCWSANLDRSASVLVCRGTSRSYCVGARSIRHGAWTARTHHRLIACMRETQRSFHPEAASRATLACCMFQSSETGQNNCLTCKPVLVSKASLFFFFFVLVPALVRRR